VRAPALGPEGDDLADIEDFKRTSHR